jgi:hypothetical protein
MTAIVRDRSLEAEKFDGIYDGTSRFVLPR